MCLSFFKNIDDASDDKRRKFCEKIITSVEGINFSTINNIVEKFTEMVQNN